MTIWTYVIVSDDGGAPNFEPPATTLAICKPAIRRIAVSGDLVLAFNSVRSDLDIHSVRWAGIVSQSMSMGEYWNDPAFGTKKPENSQVYPDNIYRPTPDGLRQVPNPTHGPANAVTDKGGKNVLVFGRRWYFGENQAILPSRFGLRMPLPARQGHRRHDLTSESVAEVVRWLEASLVEHGTEPAHRPAEVHNEDPDCAPRSCGPPPLGRRRRTHKRRLGGC